MNVEKSALLGRHSSYFETPCIWRSVSDSAWSNSIAIFVYLPQFKVQNFLKKTITPFFWETPGSRCSIIDVSGGIVTHIFYEWIEVHTYNV